MVAPLEFASSAITNGPQVSVRDRKEREKESEGEIANFEYNFLHYIQEKEEGERMRFADICVILSELHRKKR